MELLQICIGTLAGDQDEIEPGRQVMLAEPERLTQQPFDPIALDRIAHCFGDAQPQARVTRVDLRDLSLDGLTLRFDIEVENPYGVALPLLGLDYALASRGTRFLSGNAETEGSVPARGSLRSWPCFPAAASGRLKTAVTI